MKTILHITKGKPGGLDVITSSLVDHLKTDYNQEVIYFYEEGSEIYQNFKATRVAIFQMLGEVVFVNLFGVFKKMWRADFIHVHHTKIWILASPLIVFSRKIFFTFHVNFGAEYKKNFIEKFLIHVIVTYCSIFSKRIILLTNGQREHLVKYSWFKKGFLAKSIIIPNFIDEHSIVKEKRNFDFDIMFVGRNTKIKGFDDLMSLAKDLVDLKFFCLGDKGEIKEHLPNLINYGQVSHSDVLSYYDKHSVFILPSYSEVFPVSILEAMSRGLVVLSSDLPGMREIVKDARNGYIFPAGNILRMKEIINFLRNNPRELQRISKNNIQDVRKFSASMILKEYSDLYLCLD